MCIDQGPREVERAWALELIPVLLFPSCVRVAQFPYLLKSQFTLIIDFLLRCLTELMWEALLLHPLTYFCEKLWIFSCSLILQVNGAHNIKRKHTHAYTH